MILERIELKNFRQFYGAVCLEFDIVNGSNITIIHAENGVGKTALLNAVNWAFYEKLTSNFRNPRNLVNDTAQKEGEENCSVEVQFKNDEERFLLIRWFNKKNGTSTVKIKKMDGSTWGADLSEPDQVINTILPKEMSEYFFFQGEGSNAVDAGNSQGNLKNSIRNILGFKVAENLLETLKSLNAKIRREIAASDKTGEASRIENELLMLEEKINDLKNRKFAAEQKKPQVEKEIEVNDLALSQINNKDLSSLRVSEQKAKADIVKFQNKKTTYGKEKYGLIAKYGWAVFGKGFANTSMKFIDQSELKGKIPEPYNQQLIMDLLEATQCICGRPLESSSLEYKKITSLLAKAANPILSQRLKGINGHVYGINTYSKDAHEAISRTIKLYDEADEDLQQAKKEYESIHNKIIEIPVEKIAKHQKISRNLIEDRDNLIRAIERIDGDLYRIQRKAKELEQKKSLYSSNESIIKSLNERKDFINELSTFLKEYLDKVERDVRLHVLEEVNKTLESFSRHDFKIKVSNNFEFVLLDKNDNKVGQGDGLNLLLNLTITTALITFAGKHKGVKDPILNSTTVAPLFIDAPFGVLDNKYRNVVVRELPEKVNQIIFLVSSSQWTEEMDKVIRDSVNTEYCVILEESAEQNDKEVDNIFIKGKEVIMSRYGCDKDRTVVEKVY